MEKKDWEEKVVKRPGRVRGFLRRKYGSKAFLHNGNIKLSYIDMEIKRLRSTNKTPQQKSLLRAFYLARTFKTKLNRR